MAEVKSAVSTTIPYKLVDGKVVHLRLAWANLKLLKTKKPELYEEFNRIFTKGAEDVFDYMRIIYTAYVCNNIDDCDSLMSNSAFVELIPENLSDMMLVATNLIKPSKK